MQQQASMPALLGEPVTAYQAIGMPPATNTPPGPYSNGGKL